VKGAPLRRNVVVRGRLRKTRPDVFWSPWLHAPYRPNCPTVLTVHDIAPALFPRSKAPFEVLAFRTALRHPAWGGQALAKRVAAIGSCRMLGVDSDSDLLGLYQAAGCGASVRSGMHVGRHRVSHAGRSTRGGCMWLR